MIALRRPVSIHFAIMYGGGDPPTVLKILIVRRDPVEPKFTCTTVETQRDFLEVAYKISFVKNALWVAAEIAGGIGCVAAALKGVGDYLLPCGIVLLVMGIWGLSWPGLLSLIVYKMAL